MLVVCLGGIDEAHQERVFMGLEASQGVFGVGNGIVKIFNAIINFKGFGLPLSHHLCNFGLRNQFVTGCNRGITRVNPSINN